MLISLHVKNLALIEETEVFFGQGLNILTGETGAGKSVVLGSVALALGQKADRDMIRTGADYALIELNFEVTEAARRKLAEMDIPVDDDQVILQRRVMPARSICRINGETVNVRILKELAGLLIDIHGQHDSQVLLQTKRHLEILDGYAGEQLSEVDGLLNDFNRTVSDYLSDIEFEEETFRAVEKRLDDINRLKDKYGRSISEVLLYAKRRQEELDRLNHQDEWLSAKRAELARAQERLTELAGKLTGIRKKAAKAFTADMQAALQDMNFLHVEFEVSLTGKEECGPDGMDDAVFLISTNPGEPVKPLASIASGGELSRIMLALKTITAKQETIGTFIFDEIDAGISGKTAWKVSQKLGILAKTHQIICITHLPQIAAMADHHFYIEKNAVGASTETTIEELSEDGSLKELARLSGAAELTPSVLANAKEMKELAEKNK